MRFFFTYVYVRMLNTRQWTDLRVLSTPYVYVGRKKNAALEINPYSNPVYHYDVLDTARWIFWYGCRCFSARHGKFWQCKRCRLGTFTGFSHAKHYTKYVGLSTIISRASFYASVNT